MADGSAVFISPVPDHDEVTNQLKYWRDRSKKGEYSESDRSQPTMEAFQVAADITRWANYSGAYDRVKSQQAQDLKRAVITARLIQPIERELLAELKEVAAQLAISAKQEELSANQLGGPLYRQAQLARCDAKHSEEKMYRAQDQRQARIRRLQFAFAAFDPTWVRTNWQWSNCTGGPTYEAYGYPFIPSPTNVKSFGSLVKGLG